MGTIEIAQRRIGDRWDDLFIVAEVGTTIGGDLETGLKLIEAAKQAGADAIKPILTDPEGLMADKTQTYRHVASDGEREDNIFQLLSETKLSPSEWTELRRAARDADILFGLTVDTPAGLRVAEDSCQPDFYKLSSWDLRNAPLIYALGTTKKPIFIDLGPAVIGEVYNVLEALWSTWNCKVVLLHASHANAPEEFNMASIGYLKKRFEQIPIGWSNDGREDVSDFIAISQGACVIEKRLTLDRRSKVGHHHWKSLEPDEFQAWVKTMRRGGCSMIGRDGLFPSFEDIRQRDLYYTSLRVGRDISPGEILRKEDLVAKRPGNGISPFFAYLFEGKRAARTIEKDQALAWEDIKR